MHLRPNLPPSPYDLFRGNGAASIPDTGGNPSDPHFARPASAAFFSKADLLGAASLDYGHGKLFLGRLDQKMIGIADGRHIVTLAGSGGGKSVCSLIPNLMLYEGSALVLDPKGELANATAKHRAHKAGHSVAVLDPFGITSDDCAPYRTTLNPLSELADDREFLIENTELLADALIIPAEKDPHWTDSARALVRMAALLQVVDPANGGQSLADLPALISRIAAETARKGGDDAASGLLDDLAAVDLADVPADDLAAWAVIKNQAQAMVGMGDKERASVISTARTQLTFLDSPAMARAVASSALALADLKRSPSTVYLCLPAARMGTHSRWLRLIVNLAIAALERERSAQPLPVLLLLEEFAALGTMRTLENAVAYMRGFGVKVWAVLQDLNQLKRDYPKSWETFLGNAGVLQAFSVNDLSTLEYLSKRMGETTLLITNKQEVNTAQAMAGDTGLRREFQRLPLMSPDEIGRKFAHKVAPDGRALGGLSLVLWSGKAPMMVERVFHGELMG
jgi:type IV secretion system protein VirD4